MCYSHNSFPKNRKHFFGRREEKWQKLQNITKFQDCCFSSQNRWILWVFNTIQQLFFNWKHNSMIFKSSSIVVWLLIYRKCVWYIRKSSLLIKHTRWFQLFFPWKLMKRSQQKKESLAHNSIKEIKCSLMCSNWKWNI